MPITTEEEWSESSFIKDKDNNLELEEELIELPMHIRDEYAKIIEERSRRTIQ